MADIRFETGVVEYNVNDAVVVRFNPTDGAFVERVFDTFDELDKKQETYKEEIDKCEDVKEIFEVARRRDTEMREMIDCLFDKPVCDSLFGSMNVYAMAGGLPVWCNLMLAIIDQIDTTFAREQKATNQRIKKYTERWKK